MSAKDKFPLYAKVRVASHLTYYPTCGMVGYVSEHDLDGDGVRVEFDPQEYAAAIAPWPKTPRYHGNSPWLWYAMEDSLELL